MHAVTVWRMRPFKLNHTDCYPNLFKHLLIRNLPEVMAVEAERGRLAGLGTISSSQCQLEFHCRLPVGGYDQFLHRLVRLLEMIFLGLSVLELRFDHTHAFMPHA